MSVSDILAPLQTPMFIAEGVLSVPWATFFAQFTQWRKDIDNLTEGLAFLTARQPVPPPSRIACSAFNSAVQSIPNNAWTSLTFDSEDFDTAGIHSITVNTSRFTVPAGRGGLYLCVGQVNFGVGVNANYGVRILKNGAAVLAYQYMAVVATTIQNVSCVALLVAGDDVEVQVIQTTGVAQNTAAGSGSTFGQLAKVNP